MKKALVIMLVTSFASVAFASSLAVPFFLDNGGNGWPIPDGTGGFIGIKNNTDREIQVGVEYTQANGDDRTDRTVTNTFPLGAGVAVSWRPLADDPVEGSGQAVPNMTPWIPGTNTPAGSARISWVGLPSDIQGRYQQVTATDNSGVVTYDAMGYLLPPGVSTAVAK